MRRGVPGEIIFQNADGTTPAVAYFKNAATDGQGPDGWLRMGDIAERDAEGWYYFPPQGRRRHPLTTA